jgi:hypothetical protein
MENHLPNDAAGNRSPPWEPEFDGHRSSVQEGTGRVTRYIAPG